MDFQDEPERLPFSERRRELPTLSREEVEAIAEAIVRKGEQALVNRFYGNLGKGLWAVVWKALVLGLVALAAYGAANGGHRPWG